MAKQDKSWIEDGVIELVRNERNQWEDAYVFVTDKIAFHMRNLLKQLRKNYWGIFDEPVDPSTGRKKTWVPLSQEISEAWDKNADIDQNSLSFIARKPHAVGQSRFIRSVFTNELDRIFFDENLDSLIHNLGVDGTYVWKTFEAMNEEMRRKTIGIVEPDLLNLYLDPASKSLQDAYRVTERALMTEGEIKSMDWINTKDVEGTFGLHPTDNNLSGQNAQKGSKFVDVWELWGKIPKKFITGKEGDEEEIDGHIVVSGLDSPGKELVHLIEENKKGLKPYEECWAKRVAGRWYGQGPLERIMFLQVWMNAMINIRINRAYVTQLGIFKVKKNTGITPQMVSKLASNGAIYVNDVSDIEQFVMQEVSAASYKDEDTIRSWAQRVTSAFEVATGESLPSSMPATNAAIQSRSSQSSFVLVKKGIGNFLKRWVKRHALPLVLKNLKENELIEYSDKVEEMRRIDEAYVNRIIFERLRELGQAGQVVSPEQVQNEAQKLLYRLKKLGDKRFVVYDEKYDPTDVDVKVTVKDGDIDKGILAQNLINTLSYAPEYRQVILPQIFDAMGLDITDVESINHQQPMMETQGRGTAAPAGQMQMAQNPQQQFLNANTL